MNRREAREGDGGDQGRPPGRYAILEQIGRGSDAVVYRAEDRWSGNIVALKALRRMASPAAGARLRREFARLAALRHPHLLSVFDLGVAGPSDAPLIDGQVFFTAEYVEGSTARGRFLAAGPGERPSLALGLLSELASALGHVHDAGLVHGDVKPDNVLIGTDGARLCDLGLARARTLQGEASGTPAYMAPEALGGDADARSDLWSLGVTLWELIEGAPPFAGEPPEIFRRILSEPLPSPRMIPPDLARVLGRLLSRDPGLRYACADHVEAEAARLRGDSAAAAEILSRGRPLRSPALCGREAEMGRLVEILQAAASGSFSGAIAVAGPPGSGKSRLVREAVRFHQVRSAAGLVQPIDVIGDERLRATGSGGIAALVVGFLDSLVGRDRPTAVLVREGISDPLPARLVDAHLRDGGVGASRLLLVVESDAEPGWSGRPDTEVIRLGPLDRAASVRLLETMGGEFPTTIAARLARAAGGVPGVIEQLAHAWRAGIQAAATGNDGEFFRRRVGALPPRARAVAEALAVLGGPANVADVAAVLSVPESWAQAALVALGDEGVSEERDGRFEIRLAAMSRAISESLRGAAKRRLHERAASLLPPDAPARSRARHAEVLAPRAAPALALEAGREALSALAFGEAIEHLEFALRSPSAILRERAALALAEVHTLRADYPEALAALARGGRGEVVRLERGRLLLRAGRYDEAEARLRPMRARGGKESRLEAGALLGRIALARGRADRARDLCGDPMRIEPTPAGRAALEVAGLARMFLGDPGGARACFARMGTGDPPPRVVARARSLMGMVAHEEGDFSAAAEAYAEALELAERAGDVHAVALLNANRGSVDIERGHYGDALRRVASAARHLGRLGRTTEWAGALFNHGNLLVRLGDVRGGRQMLAQAEQAAAASGGRLDAHVASLRGDLALAEADAALAVASYGQAVRILEGQPGPSAPLGIALLGRCAAQRELGEIDEARVSLARAEKALRASPGHARVVLERGRLEIESGNVTAEIEDELSDSADRLRTGGAVSQLWRAELLLGLVRRARGRDGSAAFSRALAAFREVVMGTPDPYREGLMRDADARRLHDVIGSPPGSKPVAATGGTPAEARLRRLLAINKRLNSEQRLPRLLEYIVDTVIELCDAERGFLVLVDDRGGTHVRTARNISAQTLAADEFALSRSIAERAARGGEPIVTVDAASDDRFSAAMSVSAMRLRSVLAVPLSVKGRVVGTLYVDHRLRRGAFTEENVATVLDFADQAAIAIDNARMGAELRRQARQIDRIRLELERRVERQTGEIAELKTEVAQTRDALRVRYRYDNLVGRSRPMRDLYALLDRITQTELPVVICGESGTGKELVARALHSNGPRRGRAFVSENCAAIPETLLESILFGHVRGAFTGADRDRKGLFEVADGGTLFLDEVGEMSAGMQSGLLRVLQEGEFRRVGGERVLRASVRVIAASNRDLRKLVSEGRFREDLFYRLSVVRIDVPPLRDRREDIPLLCEHFLAKHFPDGAREIDPEAVRALSAYGWPGNVRELENVVLRAAALGDGKVRLGDLPPEVQPGRAATTDPNDLRIRPRVAQVERELIHRALERAAGNQSEAARMLGVSRFGLHKKMQRLRIHLAT